MTMFVSLQPNAIDNCHSACGGLPDALFIKQETGPVEPWNGSVTTWYSREFGEWNSNGYGAWIHASNSPPGLFSASSGWSSGADFKRRMLEYSQTCLVAVFIRDSSEGRVYLDEDGRPCIAYQLNEYDRRTMIKVCGSSGIAWRETPYRCSTEYRAARLHISCPSEANCSASQETWYCHAAYCGTA